MRVCEFVWGVSISIHALLAESDPWATCGPAGGRTFLSTLSLRRATVFPCFIIIDEKISIHALLAESDLLLFSVCSIASVFLSTLSLRRATPPGLLHSLGGVISIHALLAESDLTNVVSSAGTTDFYPRSPCGERPASGFFIGSRSQFLSTLSLRRATY